MDCLEQLDTLIEQKYGELKNNMGLKKKNKLLKKITIATGTVAVGAVVKARIAAGVGTAGGPDTAALVDTPGRAIGESGTAALVSTAGGTGTAALAGTAGGVGTAGAVGTLGLAVAAIAAVLLASLASKKYVSVNNTNIVKF